MGTNSALTALSIQLQRHVVYSGEHARVVAPTVREDGIGSDDVVLGQTMPRVGQVYVKVNGHRRWVTEGHSCNLLTYKHTI